MKRSANPTLDIVTSAKNEELNIPILYEQIRMTMMSEDYDWRLIICDNDSIDRTWSVIEDLATKYDNISAFQMSRDFGFEASIFAAIKNSTADVVIMMTSDLQDPPESIPSFLREYEAGFDHVYQIVDSRPGVSRLRNFNSKVFYYFANHFSGGLIVKDSSVFRLISRNMANALVQIDERNRFVRALLPWLGFRSKGIVVERKLRIAGNSKASSRVAIKYAIKGVLSNSYSLLDFIGLLGLFVFGLSIVTLLGFFGIWMQIGVPFAGYGLVVSAIVSGFGLVFLCLGVMAQYLSLIYEEVKRRPNYVVRETSGKGAFHHDQGH
jgi:glycosyltransferase involved in cell wall biosynthesis